MTFSQIRLPTTNMCRRLSAMAKRDERHGKDECKQESIPLFIYIPLSIVPGHSVGITYHGHSIATYSCASSVSSRSRGSIDSSSDRWMSSSSKDYMNSTVAAAAAPRFPRRLCSDLSGDEELIPSPPQLKERKSLGDEPNPHHDLSPKLPQRSWALPIHSSKRNSRPCSFVGYHGYDKHEALATASSVDMDAPAALAA